MYRGLKDAARTATEINIEAEQRLQALGVIDLNSLESKQQVNVINEVARFKFALLATSAIGQKAILSAVEERGGEQLSPDEVIGVLRSKFPDALAVRVR